LDFVSDLNVLPLPYYGMILGIDWLEAHNPMTLDWVNKWMVINIQGDPV
jgi:hypothetical protein